MVNIYKRALSSDSDIVKIVPEMTYKVSSGTLNLCSLTHSDIQSFLAHEEAKFFETRLSF